MDTSIASMNRSTFESRQRNVIYLRNLYSLFALSLIIAFLWSWWWISSTKIGDWVADVWWLALITGIICVLLVLATYFVPALGKAPASYGIYAVFVLFFAYTWGYLCATTRGESNYWFYVLSLLTAIAIGFAIYAWCTSSYLHTLGSCIIVGGACLIVLFLFLVFSKIAFMWLILIMIPIMIFGFYLNHDTRQLVRSNTFDSAHEDGASGAVRIWFEGTLVFCRFAELVGRMFSKH